MEKDVSKHQRLVILTPEEEEIYFNSSWYRELMKRKRQDLIKKRIIVRPAYHKNNPHN